MDSEFRFAYMQWAPLQKRRKNYTISIFLFAYFIPFFGTVSCTVGIPIQMNADAATAADDVDNDGVRGNGRSESENILNEWR